MASIAKTEPVGAYSSQQSKPSGQKLAQSESVVQPNVSLAQANVSTTSLPQTSTLQNTTAANSVVKTPSLPKPSLDGESD